MAQPRDLSKREQEVVQQLLKGKSNKLIAAALHISERTVEFHLINIYEKLEVRSRTELILKLGDSTVADVPPITENRGRLTAWARVAPVRETFSKFYKELLVKTASNPNTRDGEIPMTFFESVRACLIAYANFQGRASRPEFWWFTLFITLVTSALTIINENLGRIFLIAMLLPFLAAGARRLRDSGQNVGWLWVLLVPVGGLVTLGFLWAMPSTPALPEDNLL